MPGTEHSRSDGVAADASSAFPATLYAVILPHCRDFASIKKEYPFIATLKVLLGAVPNVIPPLLLFPGAFSAQSIGVSVFFNQPMSLLGLGTDFTSVGLSSFTAAERFGSSYCTMHGCSILKRFGASDGLVAGKYETPAQEASAAFGAALGPWTPVGVGPAVREMMMHFSRGDVEWHALALGIMGYLNTVNEILGTDLEEGMVHDTAPLLAGTGWRAGQHELGKPMDELQEMQRDFRDGQGWKTKLEVLWHAPSALVHEVRHMWGIPGEKHAVREYLTERLGGTLSVLDDISFSKPRKTVAMILRDHVMGEDCTFSKSVKYAVGEAYAFSVGNENLEQDMHALYLYEKGKESVADRVDVTADLPDYLKQLLRSTADYGTKWAEKVMAMLRGDRKVDDREIPGLLICLSAISQPMRKGANIVKAVAERLPASEVMETVSWIGVLVMLNRLMAYYAVAKEMT